MSGSRKLTLSEASKLISSGEVRRPGSEGASGQSATGVVEAVSPTHAPSAKLDIPLLTKERSASVDRRAERRGDATTTAASSPLAMTNTILTSGVHQTRAIPAESPTRGEGPLDASHVPDATDTSPNSHDASTPVMARRTDSVSAMGNNHNNNTPTAAQLAKRRQTLSPSPAAETSNVVLAVLPGMQLKRDTGPIIEKLKGRSKAQLDREAEFRKLFQLAETDLLVGDWSGAYMKGVARQGRLFVFTEHLAFCSTLFGVKTCFTVPFVDILSIEKTVENLTPGFVVRTAGQELHFGGIYNRTKCLEMINSVWKGRYVLVEVGGDNEEAELDGSSGGGSTTEVIPEELLSSSSYAAEDGFLNAADELQELLVDELPITPTKFFQLFCSNESTFEHDYHVGRGDTDVKVGQWKPHAQFGITRDVTYTLKLSAPMGPPTTRTEEIHRYHLQRDRLIIDTSMQMLDAPYGDYFRVESQWVVAAKGETRCTVRVCAKAVFSKSTILKGTISSRTLSGMTESFGGWMKSAHAMVDKLGLNTNKDNGSPNKRSSPNGAASEGDTTSAPAGTGGAVGAPSVSARRVASGGLLSSLPSLPAVDLGALVKLTSLLVNVLMVYVLLKLAARL